jgi:DNA-binding response OmpR family regulator
VIIVEADATLRNQLIAVMQEVRAHCIAFETEASALDYVMDSHAHCSLLIAGHALDGQDQCRELAAMFRAKWPRISVIHTGEGRVPTDKTHPGVAYVREPWSAESLLESAASLLQPGVPVVRPRVT